MKSKSILLTVSLASFLVFITMGIRQTYGILIIPLEKAYSINRETISLILAIQNLILAIPIFGILIDKWGYRKVSSIGALILIVGFLLIIFSRNPTLLFLSLGIVLGLGLGQNGYIVSLGSIAAVSPTNKKSTYFGIATATSSLGMFLMVPFAQSIIDLWDWEKVLWIYLALGVIIFFIAQGLPELAQKHSSPAEKKKENLKNTFQETFKNKNYVLLTLGFFVCGFHVAFIAIHLPAYLSDKNISTTIAATSLSAIGLMNIFGSFFWGKLGDYFSKKKSLATIYFLRGLAIILFLFLPHNSFTSIGFGVMIGFLWLGTVPLTSSLVYEFFSGKSFASRYNLIFFSHQIGAFLGIYLGGKFYQIFNDYLYTWYLSIILAFLAGSIHLFIKEKTT